MLEMWVFVACNSLRLLRYRNSPPPMVVTLVELMISDCRLISPCNAVGGKASIGLVASDKYLSHEETVKKEQQLWDGHLLQTAQATKRIRVYAGDEVILETDLLESRSVESISWERPELVARKINFREGQTHLSQIAERSRSYRFQITTLCEGG